MQTVTPETVGLSSARLARLSPVMKGYLNQGTFAGIVTLIARKSQVAHLEAFGWQDLENRRPMKVDTIFRIYSMSKPVTSTAVMMLFEQGKLRLADPLSRYLPDFKEPRVMVCRPDGSYDLVPARREITIHDLLTHSGGLSYGSDEHSALDKLYRETISHLDKDFDTLETWMQGFARARLPLAFQPGTDFRYGFSIDVLGYIVQLASGQLFEEYLQERIFTPLGMPDTAFWVPPEKLPRLAKIYGPTD